MTMAEIYLTRKEVGKILNLSEEHVQVLIDDGFLNHAPKLQTLKLSEVLRFKRLAELNKFQPFDFVEAKIE